MRVVAQKRRVTSPFLQHDHRIRLEWAREGVATLTVSCSVVIIVDVLSFSTTVDVAVTRGASVLPLPWRDRSEARTGAAVSAGAVPAGTVPAGAVPAGVVLAGRRGSVSWSLSPSSLLDLPAGTRLALPSPNGATLSAAAAGYGATVLAGCLRNASAVAAAAVAAAGQAGAIGVVPAGERWPDGTPRPAVEDLLGAGAVVAALARYGVGPCSPEALAAADAFQAARHRGFADLLADCSSGRELLAGGFGADVALAAEYDASAVAPVLRAGEYGPR